MNGPIWMPHPAHFIAAQHCRFHLATYINGVIVSTVGDYIPPHAEKPVVIGLDRLYETMVFRAVPQTGAPCGCPFVQESGENIDFEGYNDPDDAREGHLRFVEKYAAGVPAHG